MDLPLLLLDVDGVISLFGFDPERPPAGRFLLIDGIPHFLSGTAGEQLWALAKGFELWWCTGWEERANEYLPWSLGIPGPLPCITFEVPPSSGHWKLEAIDRCVAGSRALAWIDDAFDEGCFEWAARREGPTLLVRTDPAVGMTASHVERLLEFSRTRRGAPRPT
jgi:hypothetical protein